jgi:hypothetical protein
MEFAEWKTCWEAKPELIRPGDDPNTDYSEHEGHCVVKNLVPLRVQAVSSAIAPSENQSLSDFPDIEILDEAGDFLGLLFPSKNKDIVDPNESYVTDARYAAYLADVDISTFLAGAHHRFKHHYLVLDKSKYQSYTVNYMDSAPIWGNFFHEKQQPILAPTHKILVNSMTALPNLRMPEPEHIEKSARALVQPYAYERFLNQYHLLELIFNRRRVEFPAACCARIG